MSGIKEVLRDLAITNHLYRKGEMREATRRLRETYKTLQRIEHYEKKWFVERMTPVVEALEATASLTKEIRDAVKEEHHE